MATQGRVTDNPRPCLVPLSVRVTDTQGYWLDARARRLGRSTGEALRAILDEMMARDEAVDHGTQPPRKPFVR